MTNPKYQVMRDLTQSEYAELKESIIQNGVLVAIVFDEKGNILDGHHRLKICKELGITDYPLDIKTGLTEDEKIEIAYQLNEARRQLTAEEKRQETKLKLQKAPELSDRQIAKQVGVSNVFVSGIRKELEKDGQVLTVNTSKGADGKEYPRQSERKNTPVIQTPPEPDIDPLDLPAVRRDIIEDFDEYVTANQMEIEECDDSEEDEPTTKIIDFTSTQNKKSDDEYEKFVDGDNKYKELGKVVNQIKKLKFADEDIDAIVYWHNSIVIRDLESIDETIGDINEAIKILREIGLKLLQSKGDKNVKNRY